MPTETPESIALPLDTAATDTAAVFVPVTALDDTTAFTMTVAAVPSPPSWQQGLEPVPRPGHTGHDQGVVSLIVVIMLAMCLSFKNIQRIWGTLTKKLWSTRVRQGFDDTTGAETRTVALLLSEAIIFIAVLATAGLALAMPAVFTNDLPTTLRVAAIVAGYFVFQYAAYATVGYTFATEDGRRLWVQGFTAAMTLLGITLLVPGLITLFYPELTSAAVWIAVFLYLLARIMFIRKGFRIFYTNFASLVYFILYLCSLEIIPIAIIFYFVRLFCSS